ncbi:MAG: NB-ARC domain-containing protein [Cyanobacteria bacterium P01_A01_bin.135]
MTADDALAVLDTVEPALSLTTLQEAVFRAAWDGQRYSVIARDTGYDPDYIKYVGSQLWRSLSVALGEKVTKTSLRAVLQRRQRQRPGPVRSDAVDWGEAPDLALLYGRESELATLQRWVTGDRCRLVVLIGMGGTGKTALAAALLQRIACQTSGRGIWRSLRQAPSLSDLLTDLLWALDPDWGNSRNLGKQQAHLLNCLSRDRHIIVLDNLESLLERGGQAQYQPGYDAYGDFLLKLAKVSHSSTVVLTTRSLPKSLVDTFGERARSFSVEGLNSSAGQQLIQASGVTADANEGQELVTLCSGNPLALRLTIATIHSLFGGQASAFLAHGPAPVPKVRDLVVQQLMALGPLARQVMVWLAIYRDPAALGQLQHDLLPPPPMSLLLEALQTLRHRSLIEPVTAAEPRYTQQPVVMEAVTQWLIQQSCDEIVAGPPATISSATASCLHHYPLLLVTVAEHVQAAQRSLLLRPAIARLQYCLGGLSQVEQRLHRLLKMPQPGHSYAKGTLLNLLGEMGADVAGQDLSNQCLWQTDFRHLACQDLCLHGADLSRCRFIQPFGEVLAVAYSADGSYLAAGDSQCTVRVWDVAQGQVIWCFEGHQGWVETLIFDPTQPRLLSGSNDWTVKVWDTDHGACVASLRGHTAWVLCVAVSPDGGYGASSSTDGTIRLWNLDNYSCEQVLRGHSADVRAIAFTADGQQLISGGDDGTIRLWDLATGSGRILAVVDATRVLALAISPDGNWVAAGCADGTLRVWNGALLQARSPRVLSGHSRQIEALCFCPSSTAQVATASLDGTVRLWDLSQGVCQGVLQGHDNWVMAIAASPRGQLASGSTDQTIRLWHSRTRRCDAVLQGYTSTVIGLAAHPHHPWVASAGRDGVVRLWDLAARRCIRSFLGHGNQVWRLAFNPSGTLLASGSVDATIRLWELETDRCQRTLVNRIPWVFGLAFDATGTQVFTTGQSVAAPIPCIQRWVAATGEPLPDLQVFPKAQTDRPRSLRALAVSTDGRVACGGSEGNITVWCPTTGDCLADYRGHTAHVEVAAFSPDSQWLASAGGDRTIRLWHWPSGNCRVLTGHSGQIRALIFLSTTCLVSASNDGTLRRWDLASGIHQVLTGHKRGVYGLTTATLPQEDGTTLPILVSGGLDGTIRLWHGLTGNCLGVLPMPGPYAGMAIAGAVGISDAQRDALVTLGAVG